MRAAASLHGLNAKRCCFLITRSKHLFSSCRTQASIPTVPAMEPGIRGKVGIANAFCNLDYFVVNLFFLNAFSFGRRVVFEVVESRAFHTMAVELCCQPVQSELNAVHGVERITRRAGFVIEHEHAPTF